MDTITKVDDEGGGGRATASLPSQVCLTDCLEATLVSGGGDDCCDLWAMLKSITDNFQG